MVHSSWQKLFLLRIMNHFLIDTGKTYEVCRFSWMYPLPIVFYLCKQ